MKKWMKNLKEINGQINYLFDQYNLLHLKTQIFLKNKDNLLQQIIELTKLFSEEITKQFQPHYNNLSEPPKNQEANPPLPNSTKNPSYELHDAETKLNHILKSLESQKYDMELILENVSKIKIELNQLKSKIQNENS